MPFSVGPKSKKVIKQANRFFPGGVNSPVRSWAKVGGTPFVVAKARGAELIDVDGKKFIDFVGSWGPQIIGHALPSVVKALQKQAVKGTGFGCPTAEENELATLVQEAYPSMERLRFVSSGTEACMHVLRVARGFTGRNKILKFEGCYHGASDAVLVKAGSGAATLGIPDSAGVPAELAKLTITVPFNDLKAAQKVLKTQGKDIAAVILEPVVGNSGVLIPEDGFLKGLAKAAKAAGALLIFDEVMTGFRLAFGGAQERFGMKPDLTTLGKIVGGGMPCAAYGGKRKIMEKIAPLGPVYQAGTLSGNPAAMVVGCAVLKQLRKKGTYNRLEKLSAAVEGALLSAAEDAGWSNRIQFNRVGSMFTLFFTKKPVRNFADAAAADGKLYAKFFHGMLKNGVYLAPSPFEAGFVNLAFDDRVIRKVSTAAKAAFKSL